MKQLATKYTTTYTRVFSCREMEAAAKAAFIKDLGGVEGMARRGVKESSIKVKDAYGRGAYEVVVESSCAQIGEPNAPVVVEVV